MPRLHRHARVYDVPTRNFWSGVATQLTLDWNANLNDARWFSERVELLLARLDSSAALQLCHEFQPMGLSLYFVGERVEVAIHTWPEHRALTVDVKAREDAPALLDSLVHILAR